MPEWWRWGCCWRELRPEMDSGGVWRLWSWAGSMMTGTYSLRRCSEMTSFSLLFPLTQLGEDEPLIGVSGGDGAGDDGFGGVDKAGSLSSRHEKE